MIYYFEINNKFMYGDTRYYRCKSPNIHENRSKYPDLPKPLSYGSDRIWVWDQETDEVKFVKNRHTGTMTPVDRQEFLMVQLQAVEWKNETAYN